MTMSVIAISWRCSIAMRIAVRPAHRLSRVKKFGISIGVVPDLTLFDSAVFVLAARADMQAEEFRRRFPQQLKIGPVEKIRDLVNLQLPGIGLVLAAVIIAEIGDVTRFKTAAQLCSWAGLTPRHRESDVKVIRGHVTKQGSRMLR